MTVFMKGCSLHCSWCHNPEGLSPLPQVIHGAAGDRVAGQHFTSGELALRLNSQAELMRVGEGGVSFCGGEPLFQADFLTEVIDQLSGIHLLLDTSGHASEKAFERVASKVDLVYFDLKLIDSQEHRRYTGDGNELILRNLRTLSEMNIPFVVRVPLVPGVTDTKANLSGIAKVVAGLPGLLRVDLLPYNRAAGAKYASCGLEFKPMFDEALAVNVNTSCFENVGVEVRIV